VRSRDRFRARRYVPACCVLGAAWLTGSASALAQPNTPNRAVVKLEISACEAADGAEIAELIALELASQPGVVIDAAQPPSLQASLVCSDGHALISVQDVHKPAPLELRLELEDTRSEARPRLLALAVAELIATSRLEHTNLPEPQPDAASSASEPSAARPTTELPTAIWLGVGVLRGYRPAVWAPTLALGAAHSFGRLALAADLEFDWASQSSTLAQVGARSLGLGLAPQLQLLAGQLEWFVGLGARVAYVWLSADSRSADLTGATLSGLVITPTMHSALQLRIGERGFVRLGIELGYVVKTLRGLDAERAGLFEARGLRAVGLVGAGFRL
jgi:hypothetical protein